MKLILATVAVMATPFICEIVPAKAVTAVAGAALPPPAASAAGSLSLTPQIVEHRARVGRVGAVTVVNHTGKPLRMSLRARPWIQSPAGAVSVDPDRTLGRLVLVSPSSFTLAAGARRGLSLTLRRHPSGGSLYGGLDLTGAPVGERPRNGIAVRYRLVGSLRLDPARPRMRVRAGSLRVTGRAGRHAAVLAVRNTGNTVQPVTGRVILTGPHGTRPNTLQPVRIVPRRVVNVTLGTYRGLLKGQPRGRYRMAVTLTQGGRTVVNTTRSFQLT